MTEDSIDMKNSKAVLKMIHDLLDVDFNSNQTKIPSTAIMLNGSSKPGLSTIDIATAIINRQTQALQQQDYNFTAGGISEAMEVIRVDEIIKAIQTKMRVDVATIPFQQAPVATSAGAGTATLPLLVGYAQAY